MSGFIWLTELATAERIGVPLSLVRDVVDGAEAVSLRLQNGEMIAVRESRAGVETRIAIASGAGRLAEQRVAAL